MTKPPLVLTEAFAIKDGQIETYLASRIYARDESFIDLLSPERRASIFQPTAADTRANSKMLKGLLALTNALFPASEGAKVDEDRAAAAARDFGSGTDMMRTYRQLYAANRLTPVQRCSADCAGTCRGGKKGSRLGA